MSIEKMEYVIIAGLLKNLDRSLEKCVESGCFHMGDASKDVIDTSEGLKRLDEENPYRSFLRRIIAIETGDDFEFSEDSFEDITAMPESEAEEFVSDAEKEFNEATEEISQCNSEIKERNLILTQLRHLKGMNIDLGKLLNCTHIKVRFGKLPCDSYEKLSYYGDRTFIFVPYDDDGSYKWGFYFAPGNSIAETDNIFKTLYFEHISVPEFVKDSPSAEEVKITEDIKRLELQKASAEKKLEQLIAQKGKILNKIFCRTKYRYDIFEMRRNAAVYNDKFYIAGFIPKSEEKKFCKLLDSIDEVSVVVKPAENSGAVKTPVRLKTNRFSKPFSMFVEMYGLPSYNGFNPTTLVAVTYTLLFGIMFGDLGQGLLLALLGFFIYRKSKNKLGAIMERIGISSAFFGLIYGSVFGFEHLLDPVYQKIGLKHKPLEVMDNTNTILIGAIAIGVVIILISIIISIIINIRRREYSEAVFGNNGAAGLIFFTALLAGLAGTLTGKANLFTLPYVLGLIVLPLIVMFFREPLGCLVSGKKFHMEGGIGDFLASNFFEVFEFFLGYATNTLSFVRIGGFIFSHAGMMSVVMLLSESVSKGASPIVIILGNLFVMGMEGLIVGIQVLRLEFYEIFSRFYDGSGIAFEPAVIKYNTDIE